MEITEIRSRIKSIIDPIHAHADQMEAIAQWVNYELNNGKSKIEKAAPELLEKLQYMVDAWEDVRISGRKDIMEDFTRIAKEAIKKATE